MDSLYALTNLPSPVVRKIWYYLGGTGASHIVRRRINYVSRLEKNMQWMDTHTLWNIGRDFTGGMFSSNNPLGLRLWLWCEMRIIMLCIVKQDKINLDTLTALLRSLNAIQKRVFKSTHKNTIFNS